MITRESKRRGVVVTFTLLTMEPVSVVGDFNGWDPHVHPLPLSNEGKRSTTIELEPGRYAFRYLADGGRFFDDPEADFLEANGLGDSHGIIEIVVDDDGADDDPAAAAVVPIEAVAAASSNGASTAAPTPTPSSSSAPTSTGGDELERIEGIGPKIGQALRAGGLATFADLAGASDDRLREALAAAQLRFAPSLGTWAEQAALLARGDEAGFAALTASLTAGRPAPTKAAKAAAPPKVDKAKAAKAKAPKGAAEPKGKPKKSS